MILLTIPVVNLVLFIYWIVSNSVNLNRRNYCIAYFIYGVIMFFIVLIFFFIFGGMAAIMSHQGTQM